MPNLDFLTRQLDIIPIETLGTKITIIGVGAIGSFTTLSLAKMGFSDLTVYDFDKVSAENMSCQFFRYTDIGKPKVEALRDLVKDFTDITIDIVNKPYESGAFSGIVISAVDSMAVRKTLWEAHKSEGLLTTAFIDARMASEYALMYVMDPNDQADIIYYEKTLYTDEDAVQERCTAKATMYTVNMIAGHVAKAVKDIVTDGNTPYDVEWSIKNNHYKNWPKKDLTI